MRDLRASPQGASGPRNVHGAEVRLRGLRAAETGGLSSVPCRDHRAIRPGGRSARPCGRVRFSGICRDPGVAR